MRAWMRGCGHPVGYRFAGPLQLLREDSRLAPAGVSDPRSGIATPGIFEARCADVEFSALVGDYYLIEAPDPNVRLHAGGDGHASPISRLLLELAQHNSPRRTPECGRFCVAETVADPVEVTARDDC